MDKNKKKITIINKILYITDLHIKIKNLGEIKELKHAINTARNVSMIIIGGDVLNNRYINESCYCEAEELIKVCSRVAMTYVLVGNHDYIDNLQFLTTKHWMTHLKNWPNVVIVDKVTTIMCGFQITCVPYVPNGRLLEALDSSITYWKDSHLIFAHQEIKGCSLGKTVSSEGDFWDPSFPTLISGHIHDEQKVNNNVIYPGATINQGPQNNQQKICFINASFTSDGVFNYNIENSFFKTNKKTEVFVKTVNELYDINNRQDLTNTIVIIKEYDSRKISEIRRSQIYNKIIKRAHYVFFAD
jgi:DNA repair exonuclease SbcCD nuclease subunit